MTDPAGAAVSLYRYTNRGRSSVATFERSLGTTPLVQTPLAAGSYLCVLRAPGCHAVRYPVVIEGHDPLDGSFPSQVDPLPVRLLRSGELSAGEVYVPRGFFQAGGDPASCLALDPQRVWVEAFVMDRFPVCHRGYLAFLDALITGGRGSDALRFAPRAPGPDPIGLGPLIYERTRSGRFALPTGPDRGECRMDHPVSMVDWSSAVAYAAWRSDQTGHRWRLPTEMEWEKAARGVDGRSYPWGDRFWPSSCHTQLSGSRRLGPTGVDGYAADTSPYGVRGMAGNSQDWCADWFSTAAGPPAFRGVRGGSWLTTSRPARSAYRSALRPELRAPDLGFRLVRDLPRGVE